MDELDFGITMPLHAFPKLYQRALATGSVEARLPRVFVYSVFAHKPVQFQFRLWEPERVWSSDSRFEAMLSQIVEENTLVGSRYVNPVLGLCRRSRFCQGFDHHPHHSGYPERRADLICQTVSSETLRETDEPLTGIF